MNQSQDQPHCPLCKQNKGFKCPHFMCQELQAGMQALYSLFWTQQEMINNTANILRNMHIIGSVYSDCYASTIPSKLIF